MADVDAGGCEVWHDVWSCAAGDRADVEGGGAEDRVGEFGESGGEVFLKGEEGAGEFEDGVIAEVWLGGVC